MIKLHLTSGETIPIDLDLDGADQLDMLARPSFQDRITAVTIIRRYENGHSGQYSIRRPDGVRGEIWFEVELVKPNGKVKGGERVTVYFENYQQIVMAHSNQPAIRISTNKIGVRRFDPSRR